VLILCLVTPLIAIFILSATKLGLLLKYKNKSETLCRAYLYNAQHKMEKEISHLIKMNKKAKRLRFRRKVAQTRLALSLASGTPLMIAQAKAYLVKIKAQQSIFRSQQLLQKKYIDSQSLRLRKKVEALFNKGLENYVTQVKLKASLPSLYTSPLLSASPDYNRSLFFARKQFWSLSWQLNLKQIFPNFILNNKSIIKHASNPDYNCGATIIQKGNQWNAQILKMVKYI
jgi:hypothetical protein